MRYLNSKRRDKKASHSSETEPEYIHYFFNAKHFPFGFWSLIAKGVIKLWPIIMIVTFILSVGLGLVALLGFSFTLEFNPDSFRVTNNPIANDCHAFVMAQSNISSTAEDERRLGRIAIVYYSRVDNDNSHRNLLNEKDIETIHSLDQKLQNVSHYHKYCIRSVPGDPSSPCAPATTISNFFYPEQILNENGTVTDTIPNGKGDAPHLWNPRWNVSLPAQSRIVLFRHLF
eukprot:gb/GECH01008164.1/.p1 GENE.gb/GECH01008164.1/~~gb/GECH01008164.1/.p1  ORF type:complete len:230 (+),score=31.72 gb/GECH01008164.1/:1-690(+)